MTTVNHRHERHRRGNRHEINAMLRELKTPASKCPWSLIKFLSPRTCATPAVLSASAHRSRQKGASSLKHAGILFATKLSNAFSSARSELHFSLDNSQNTPAHDQLLKELKKDFPATT